LTAVEEANNALGLIKPWLLYAGLGGLSSICN
jgi:hypothetical protein